MDIRFLGHACFELTEGDTRVLVDPFLTGNPKAAAEASELDPTHIFLTHGHADHYGDVLDIAKRTGAQTRGHHRAGRRARRRGRGERGRPQPRRHGRVRRRLGPARPGVAYLDHAQGTVNTPAGLVISLGDKIVYHLGDTCLFSDLRLVPERDPVDVALMCIGGHYTMDRHDAAVAAELVGAGTVIPCHYDTFPPIETDAQAFKSDVESRTGGKSTVEVLDPGGTLSV